MKYDIIVIGGGPAGLYAAYTAAAKNDLRILLLEKDKEIGNPILCAEGISRRTLSLFFEKDNYDFIRNPFIKMKIRYKEKESITSIPDMGLIINRSKFDKYIAKMVQSRNVEIKTSENVINGEYINNGVKIITENNIYESKMIIIADGVESRVASFFNIKSNTELNDIYSCYQYILKDENIDDKEVIFDFTPEFAKYGYVWVFPKGNKEANFGLGINTAKSEYRAKELLENYKKKFFPNGKIIHSLAGAVPINPLKEIAYDKILICGDAGRFADPITGGGIDNALRTGKFAGEVAIQAFNKNKFDKNTLLEYDKIVNKDNGFFIEKQLKLKHIIEKMNNEDMDKFFYSVIELFDGLELMSETFFSSLFSFRSIKNKLQLAVMLGKISIKYPIIAKMLFKLL